jgi:hypothetical protein
MYEKINRFVCLYWKPSLYNIAQFLSLTLWHNHICGIDMWPYSDTLSRFRANQSLRFLLNAAFLAEKQQIPIL